jgi:hypothetical protein
MTSCFLSAKNFNVSPIANTNAMLLHSMVYSLFFSVQGFIRSMIWSADMNDFA